MGSSQNSFLSLSSWYHFTCSQLKCSSIHFTSKYGICIAKINYLAMKKVRNRHKRYEKNGRHHHNGRNFFHIKTWISFAIASKIVQNKLYANNRLKRLSCLTQNYFCWFMSDEYFLFQRFLVLLSCKHFSLMVLRSTFINYFKDDTHSARSHLLWCLSNYSDQEANRKVKRMK